jgi:hypothetical protein
MIIEAPSKSFVLSGLVLTSLSKGTVGESSILLPKLSMTMSRLTAMRAFTRQRSRPRSVLPFNVQHSSSMTFTRGW